jgi:hypothetical protein
VGSDIGLWWSLGDRAEGLKSPLLNAGVQNGKKGNIQGAFGFSFKIPTLRRLEGHSILRHLERGRRYLRLMIVRVLYRDYSQLGLI